MYDLRIDEKQGTIEFVLTGVIFSKEMTEFVSSLEAATLRLAHGGRRIKILADLRAMKPASAAVSKMIQQVQEFGIRCGVVRVAEIVESDIMAMQLNAVARQSGTDKILRRFWEDESALAWLSHDNGDMEVALE